MCDKEMICRELNDLRDLIKLRDEKCEELRRLYDRIINYNFTRIAEKVGLTYSAYGDRFITPTTGENDETKILQS